MPEHPPTRRHAQNADAILRRLHRVLENVGPALEQALAQTRNEPRLRRVHLDLELGPAEALHQLYVDGEPWPLEVRTDGWVPLGAARVRALWSLGWHHPERFAYEAKRAARGLLDAELRHLDRRVHQAWWRPGATPEEAWVASGPGDLDAYPVTVQPVPTREEQALHPTVYL